MARTQTYGIRLAIERGGQLEAERVPVGQSGEPSRKRVEMTVDRSADRSLDLSRRCHRKTAGQIGVGLEALQALRFAAEASGVEKMNSPRSVPRLDVLHTALCHLIKRSS